MQAVCTFSARERALRCHVDDHVESLEMQRISYASPLRDTATFHRLHGVPSVFPLKTAHIQANPSYSMKLMTLIIIHN